MEFAKLENDTLVYAELPLVIDGQNVWTNDASVMLTQGFYPVVRSEMPTKDGYYYTESWAVVDNELVNTWTEHAIETTETSVVTKSVEEQIADLQEAVTAIYESMASTSTTEVAE